MNALAWYRTRRYAEPLRSKVHLTNGDPHLTLCGFTPPEGHIVLRGDEAHGPECAVCKALRRLS